MVCVQFVREKNSITVSDNTIKAKNPGSFFENLGEISAKVSKKLASNVLKNPGRVLEIEAIAATTAASRRLKNVFSTIPEVIYFYHK